MLERASERSGSSSSGDRDRDRDGERFGIVMCDPITRVSLARSIDPLID